MRTYEIRTHGCQMNVHDSERLAGLLEEAGYARAQTGGAPDVVVFNTCAVRENADNRLYGNLGQLLPAKKRTRGCRSPSAAAWPRRTAARSSARRPGSTSSSAPTTSASCRCCWNGPGSRSRPRSRSPSRWSGSRPPCRPGATPPTAPGCRSASAATTPAPSASCRPCAASETDRRPGEILAEIEMLVADGRAGDHPARPERQRVRRRVRRPAGVRQAAPGVRRDRRAGAGPVHLSAPEGLHRRRDRGHGRDAERDAAAAHAAAVRVGLPCCAGCAARTAAAGICRSSRTSAPRCRTRPSPPTSSWASRARPRRTSPTPWRWSRASRFSAAFTFQYSIRAGTPAATMADQVPKAVVQERYERLVRPGRGGRLGGEPDPGRAHGSR